MLPTMKQREYYRVALAIIILSLTIFIYFPPSLAQPAGVVTVYSGVSFHNDDGFLNFTGTYSFDTLNYSVLDASTTVSTFPSDQFSFTLTNSSVDANPNFTIVTGSTEPVYILNVLNYSYATDRTLVYGQSSEQTVTMHFSDDYGSNKIIQAPTLTSAPTWLDNQFTFTATGSGTEILMVAVPQAPNYITIDGETYEYGDKWTYADGVVTITDTFSTKTIMLSYTANPPAVGIPAAIPAQIAQFSDYIVEGDFFGFLVAVYVNAFQSADLLWAFLIMLFTIPLYIRTQSLTLLMILWILVGGIFIVASPLLSGISVFLIVFAIAGLLFKLFMQIRR